MSEKLSIQERTQITLRGFTILKKYCPGLAGGKVVLTMISALQPFASVWFSARIINELALYRRWKVLAGYVTAVILLQFAASIAKNVLDKVCADKEASMWNSFGKVFSDKQMELDYVDLEDARIQQQKTMVEEDLFTFGNGLAQLVWGISTLTNVTVTLIAATGMVIPLFIQQTGNPVMDSPLWLLGLAAVIWGSALFHSRMNLKDEKLFEEWCVTSLWFQRSFKFYGQELYTDSERAKDIRIYKQERMAERVLEKLLKKDAVNDKKTFWMSVYPAAASVVSGLCNGICWIYVVLKAFYGAFAVGNIVQYVGILGNLGKGVQELMFLLADNEVYCRHLKKLYAFLDIPNHKYEGTLPVEKRAFCEVGDNDYEIEFRNVSFRYPGADIYALKNVSLKFRVGERLALVGMNGSGKTTFIKLLCRLYDPTQGEILLNGINIQKYDYEEYLSIFSVVFQDFKLFALSLAENVAAGVEYDHALVEKCLQKAGFGGRLQELPDGILTPLYKELEENGVELSGGEAQKVALARALYKDAPFIILDEPTAALDPLAEYEIYSRFNEIIENKTAVYISHRLSSCRFCDDIVVFDRGQMVQRGRHEDLVKQQGKYYELWETQAQYYR